MNALNTRIRKLAADFGDADALELLEIDGKRRMSAETIDALETFAAGLRELDRTCGYRVPVTVSELQDYNDSDYRLVVELDDGDVVERWHWGAGTTHSDWHGCTRSLVSFDAGIAWIGPIVEALKSQRGQDLLVAMSDGLTVEWNGENNVGRMTQRAVDAEQALTEWLGELKHAYYSCYSYSDPGYWYGETDTDDLPDVDGIDDDIEWARGDDIYLDRDSVEAYIEQRREEDAEDDIDDWS
jgi:hypothetical protein